MEVIRREETPWKVQVAIARSDAQKGSYNQTYTDTLCFTAKSPITGMNSVCILSITYILDQALAEPGGAEGKRVVSIHKNLVTHQFEL